MTHKIKKRDNRRTSDIIFVVTVVALVVAAAAIFISSNSYDPNTIHVDYSKIPQGRTEDGGFILGNPEAKITIIAFEDFLCPHCQEYESTISRFIQAYVATGKARFEYRFLPAIDPKLSVQVAQLVECSEILKPGSFWDAHDVMFELAEAERYNANTPRQFADRLGLNYANLLDCVPTASQIQTDMVLGKSLGVQGTPAIFVQHEGSAPQHLQQPDFEQFAIIMASSGS